jgi:hypothetical protein
MTTQTEKLPHNEGFIISEAPGKLSREEVTIFKDSAVHLAGTVMGKRDDGKWQRLAEGSSEGNAAVKGILCSDVDSTAADAFGVVIERLAEVRAADLIWPTGLSTANHDAGVAELLALNIKVRAGAVTISTQTT